ncbi:hypothetical protein V500_07840 [Pseudogymnoascus sp. VKM F-4518 (FW-2643)]|nr:hypothetical protein V500_07840 [Pseudogymnoascus sp. VKM F-4518 (FW-2643)]
MRDPLAIGNAAAKKRTSTARANLGKKKAAEKNYERDGDFEFGVATEEDDAGGGGGGEEVEEEKEEEVMRGGGQERVLKKRLKMQMQVDVGCSSGCGATADFRIVSGWAGSGEDESCPRYGKSAVQHADQRCKDLEQGLFGKD